MGTLRINRAIDIDAEDGDVHLTVLGVGQVNAEDITLILNNKDPFEGKKIWFRKYHAEVLPGQKEVKFDDGGEVKSTVAVSDLQLALSVMQFIQEVIAIAVAKATK